MNSDTSFGGTLNGRWSLPRSCTDPPRRKIIPTARKPDAEHLHIRCRRLDILPVDTHLGASAVGALGVYPCTSAKVPDCYCFLPFFFGGILGGSIGARTSRGTPNLKDSRYLSGYAAHIPDRIPLCRSLNFCRRGGHWPKGVNHHFH